MGRPLEGTRVLDFGMYIAAPFCSLLLADMGADVIRVERPGGAADRGYGPFAPNGDSIPCGITLHRNKRGITLNLADERSRPLLRELMKHSDIVVENFSLAAKDKTGLGYESLKEMNPAIIVVSISAFGPYGPYADYVGFDSTAQCMGGTTAFSGFPNNPPTRSQLAYVDYSSACLGAFSAVSALYHRERTGVGQMIDISLLDTVFSFVAATGLPAEYEILGLLRQQQGNEAFYGFANTFQTSDGYIYVAVNDDSAWRRFSKAIGHEEFASDPRFIGNMNRYENRHLFLPAVEKWMAARPKNEVVEIMQSVKIPCGAVLSVAEVMNHPQIKAREMLVYVDQPGAGLVPLGGVPCKFSRTPGKVERRAPKVGEHNEELYCGLLGFNKEALAEFQREGIV